MNRQQENPDERLWRRYAAGIRPPAGGPEFDSNVLATYLEGRADPAVVDAIEGRMAREPAFLDEILELRQARADVSAEVPPAVLARAKTLMAKPAVKFRLPAPAGLFRLWASRLQWVAVAAAVILACLGGYRLGGGAVRTRYQAQAVEKSLAGTADSLMDDQALDMPIPAASRTGDEPS